MNPFSYNYYKNLKRPHVYLSYPNRTQICEIPIYDFQTDIIANSANRGSFKVYRYRDETETEHYGDIKLGMYLYMEQLSWFVITEIQKINEGYNEYLEITYIQIEHTLSQTLLTSFGSLGVDTDSQGGLDRYCLYNPLDQPHSILHLFVQRNPAWLIGTVDPDISTEYRNFQEESVASYTFLTHNVAETYECVFLFDPDKMEVSARKLENLGKDTNITLSYQNFIKSIGQRADDSDLKTVLTVSGGNDARTNTPLGIIDVNISGTNQIYNFSYYLHMMSKELQTKLAEYEEKCRQNTPVYQEKLEVLGHLYEELNDLKNRVPENMESTNWAKFGEIPLQTKEQEYWHRMSLYVGKEDSYSLTQYNSYKPIHDAIEKELGKRKAEIASKESAISGCKKQINQLVVRINEFLGEQLYKELSLYVKEDSLTDDSFIATEIMTDAEILSMQQSLLNHAKSELSLVCYPKFESDVDLINFTIDYDYKEFTDQLEMFNVIHVRFEENDAVTDARLLKLHINWDNPSDFKATFSNRNSLDENFGLFQEVIRQTEDTSSSLSYGIGAWSNAAIVSPEIRNYMSSVFDASKQMLQSSDEQEIRIDRTGMLVKKWDSDKESFDPGQLWVTNGGLFITRDAWDTVSLALGYTRIGNDYFYGLCCESLVGKMVLSSNLYISNESGTYTMDKDGLIAKNGSYQVKINPSAPADIFSISIDNKNLLYIDATSKKLKFEGDIESRSGHIANFTITENNLASGGVGLCSLTTPGEVAIWAGNSNKISAPFRVTNRGKVICSDIEVTGGQMNIGGGTSSFGVSKDGTLTAKNADISGTIRSNAGYIGNLEITQTELSLIKNRNMSIDLGQIIIDSKGEISIGSNIVVTDDWIVFGVENASIKSDGTAYFDRINGDVILYGNNWWGDASSTGNYTIFSALDYLYDKYLDLYNYVHSGGWNPDACPSYDDCNNCDNHYNCPSEDDCSEQTLIDDIGGCGSGGTGCGCDEHTTCSCDGHTSCTCDDYGSSCNCDSQACGPGDGL
ncbi:MAG: ABC transporter ATP-binding protein [Lachnospiraceae bacterium]|jgi:hypothetical protein|nr:ABC transporter ATP-binding protein [Lachnospiraceae bacterium]